MRVSLGGDRHLQVRVAPHSDPSGHPAAPVLLLHGFMGSRHGWPEAVVASLSQDAPVIAPDLPGHGESDSPPLPERYAIERVVADLIVLLDRLDVERAHVVGYSMGGRLGLALALAHPDRVERIVLESTSPGLASEADRAARCVADEALAHRLERESFESFVDDWMALPLFESQRSLGEAWHHAERARRLDADPNALAACLRGMGTGSQPSYWHDLGAVRRPALLLTGGLDEKFGGIANRMVDLLPDARWVEVASAGHRVHAERPQAWLDHVRPFVLD